MVTLASSLLENLHPSQDSGLRPRHLSPSMSLRVQTAGPAATSTHPDTYPLLFLADLGEVALPLCTRCLFSRAFFFCLFVGLWLSLSPISLCLSLSLHLVSGPTSCLQLPAPVPETVFKLLRGSKSRKTFRISQEPFPFPPASLHSVHKRGAQKSRATHVCQAQVLPLTQNPLPAPLPA